MSLPLFASPQYAVGANPHSVAVGDFNGDGKQDFVTTNNGANNISVRLGDGIGGFAVAVNVGVGSSPEMVAVTDINRDGTLDMVVSNTSSNSISQRR